VRLWWALGTGALAILLCCGGGIAVFVGMIVTGTRAAQEQAEQTVGHYVESLERGKFDEAYNLVCDELQQRYTADDLEDLERRTVTSTGFTVGNLDLTTLQIPVQLRYASGEPREVTYQLTQDKSTGKIEVCGTA
jgi:hypothetical protein